jgi:phage shock protein A
MSDLTNKNNKLNAELSERLETDLSGMDSDAAYQYVAAYITEFKEIQKKKAEQLKEKIIWEDRSKLASDKGKQDLAAQAHEKLKDINEKILKYENRENELAMTIDVLKKELNKLVISSSNQFDAEKLLSELQAMAGELDTTKKEFKDMEINDQLDKIKKDLNR